MWKSGQTGEKSDMKIKKGNAFDFTALKKENFVVIGLIGILLLVIALPASDGKTKDLMDMSGITDSDNDIMELTDTEGDMMDEEALSGYVGSLEKSLEEILSTMEGAGKVRVMIALRSSGEAVIEKDTSFTVDSSTKVEAEGGSHNTAATTETGETVYTTMGSGVCAPYVKQVIYPRIEGVIVSAQGGDNPYVNKNITEAIQALFGIEIHKIKVIKMSS